MVSRYHVKKLIVEGVQDKRVIPELIEANGIKWGSTKEDAIVYINDYGNDQFIDAESIGLELKSSGLESIGLVVDADDDFSARWDSVRNALQPNVVTVPEAMPVDGLICQSSEGIKVGVWIMPDNKAKGMLETFLTYLVPDGSSPILDWAKEATQEAKLKEAPFKDAHFDKAYIYTWLAWQGPPGRQLHNAVQEKMLDSSHPKAQSLVNWFKKLYDL